MKIWKVVAVCLFVASSAVAQEKPAEKPVPTVAAKSAMKDPPPEFFNNANKIYITDGLAADAESAARYLRGQIKHWTDENERVVAERKAEGYNWNPQIGKFVLAPPPPETEKTAEPAAKEEKK